jgi:hypothetical protein
VTDLTMTNDILSANTALQIKGCENPIEMSGSHLRIRKNITVISKTEL